MKIFLDMVGCRLNQSEIETFARQFRKAGHSLVASASEADLVVINTCTVTREAASDSRQKIRQAARTGSENVVVTGCWSTLNPGDAKNLPGVSHVISNGDKDWLVSSVLGIPVELFDTEPIAREPLPGIRQRTRAFIKVQDGCNNRCTFCVTTLARGASRSRPVAAVIQDIRSSVEGGAKEVVLTGVHLGSWGQDLSPELHLEALVRAILRETDIPRVRLSSLEPWDLHPSFFELWEDQRMCPHLHLPLQSGSGKILRRMARKVTPDSFANLVATARSMIPGIAITTDVIVGFPGEGLEEFNESLNYVHSIGLSGGHVFTYSPRPGTAAASFPNQVSLPVKKIRNAQMRQILSEDGDRYAQGFIDNTLDVLWESADGYGDRGWHMHGLTGNDLRVAAASSTERWNEISRVKLTRYNQGTFTGEIVSSY